MFWKRLTDWSLYLLVRVFISVIQSLRIETCNSIARLLAFVAGDVVKLRGRVVDENLRSIFPHLAESDRRQLTRQMWEHLFLMVCEIAHAPRKIHRTNWYEFCCFPDHRRLVQALLDVRPKVLVTGHYGNFELGSFINGRLGFPTFTVARTLDNPYLDKYINKFRSANGQFMLPKKGSSAQVQAVLEAGYALGLVGDQHAGPKGCWVDFLGRPASCHKAIAVLTLTSGAPLIVLAGTRRRPLHFTAHLLGIVDPAKNDPECASIETLTQWYNDCLAKVIRAHPEQYWWVHRRWKGTPPKRYAARRKAA